MGTIMDRYGSLYLDMQKRVSQFQEVELSNLVLGYLYTAEDLKILIFPLDRILASFFRSCFTENEFP